MMGRSDCAVYVGKKGLVKGYFDLVVQELREVPRIMAKQSQQKITILWYMIRMVAYISVLHGAVQITFTKVPYFMNN